MQHGRDSDEPFWLDFWGPADLAQHEMRATLALGDLVNAERAARTAYTLCDAALYPRNHALYAARLGAVLAIGKKYDEAVSVTSHAVEPVDVVHGSWRTAQDVDRTLALLHNAPYRPAKEFAAAARKVIAAP